MFCISNVNSSYYFHPKCYKNGHFFEDMYLHHTPKIIVYFHEEDVYTYILYSSIIQYGKQTVTFLNNMDKTTVF